MTTFKVGDRVKVVMNIGDARLARVVSIGKNTLWVRCSKETIMINRLNAHKA